MYVPPAGIVPPPEEPAPFVCVIVYSAPGSPVTVIVLPDEKPTLVTEELSLIEKPVIFNLLL